MRRTGALLILIGLALVLVAACGGGNDDDGGGNATPTATSTPMPGGSGGGELFGGTPVDRYYAITCSGCHGADRGGSVGPALTRDQLTETDDFYAEAIANGRAGTVMPAWRRVGPLSDEEISALVTFLKTTDP